MAVSLEQFVEQLTSTGLISAEEVTTIRGTLPAGERDDVQALAKALIRESKLTKFQAQAIYQGKHKTLVFGEYVVLDKLGAGGMGVVLKARHRRMDRVVAIKVLPAASLKSPDAVERFYREVKAAARVMHPNIVTAHDAGEHEGMHFLVMEYVDGKDLSEIVAASGPLPVVQAVECILQAARGLQYAHAMGIVHRDIKPANLLLSRDGTVKILDLGLARLGETPGGAQATTAAQLTQSGQIMGTVDYMSPEQAMDTRRADERADIYSLGCTLYRLLTGESVFEGDTLMLRIMAHQQQPIPAICDRRADVPAALDAVFATMLAKDPADRQQTMAEVISDLEAALSPEADSGRRYVAEPSSDSALSEFFHQIESDKVTTKPQQATAGEQETLDQRAREEQTGDQVGRPSRLTPSDESGGTPDLPKSGETPGLLDPSHTHVERQTQVLATKESAQRRQKHLVFWLTAGGCALSLALLVGVVWLLVGDPGRSTDPSNGDGGRTVTGRSLSRGAKAGDVWDGNDLKMKFCWCPNGTFKMGEGADAVDVMLTRGFWMGKTEVTQAQWKTVMQTQPKEWGTLPDTKAGDEYPATWISWNEATTFCEELTKQQRAAGRLPPGWEYRLPTEAQWEYACRAGTTAAYSFGDDAKQLGDYAWFNSNAGEPFAHPVAGRKPNPWGLYDMHGNVWECCRDSYDAKLPAGIDPEVTKPGSDRVLRGGGWDSGAVGCHASFRLRDGPGHRHSNRGFRLAAVQVDPPKLSIGTQAGQQWDGNGPRIEFCWCPKGSFKMGSKDTGQVDVTLTRGFWMGKTEVTQAQWKAVMNTQPNEWATDANTKAGDDYPATWISWDDATKFCQELTKQEQATGRLPPDWEYRLPTEAQWEYACRAGTQTTYSFPGNANRLRDYAWYRANTEDAGEAYAHRVRQKLGNPWGLHDIHGNVWEWCRDWHHDQPSGGRDPEATNIGTYRVMRGGGWNSGELPCRSAMRGRRDPDDRRSHFGFRVTIVQVAAPPATLSIGTRAGQEWDGNGVNIPFCWCPPGEFKMGEKDNGQVDVTLTRGFWLGKTEVTQAQWNAVMKTQPEEWGTDANTKAGDDLKHVAELTEVNELYMNYTQVTGPGFAHLRKLKLEFLNCVNPGRITNEALKQLASQVHLRNVNLDGSAITDEGLAHLSGLTELGRLNLTSANVTNAGLKHLQGLKNLRHIRLMGTGVTLEGLTALHQALPKSEILVGDFKQSRQAAEWALSVGGLVELYGLDHGERTRLDKPKDLRRVRPAIFSINLTKAKPIRGADLAVLKGLMNLRILNLTNAPINNDDLKHLAGLVRLRRLDLGNTKITDAGLKHLAGLKDLTELDVRGTGVTPPGVAELGKALPKCKVTR